MIDDMQISIDIETVGPAPRGRIVQIGAVAFEMDGGSIEPMEILDQKAKWIDLVIEPYFWGYEDEQTIEWWKTPEASDARDLINASQTVLIEEALTKLSDFVRKYLGKNAGIWAKPPGFDLVCLRYAYQMTEIECPWSMKQESCIRTAAWLARRMPRGGFEMPDLSGKGLVKHNGLHDAIEQAVLAKAAWRALVEASNKRAG